MNILLVEDDDEKAQDISRFVSEHFPTAKIEVARSLQSGLRAALSGTANIILLDMTMRNYDRTIEEEGGRPHHFAGREILRQMKREDIRIPTIVITTFDRFGEETEEMTLSELEIDLRQRFPDYLDTVHYRANVDQWKGRLLPLMKSVLLNK